MENGGGKDGVGVIFVNIFDYMIECVDVVVGNYRYGDCI